MSESVVISDDALKLLVAEHGIRGTARLLGMTETQMNTFKQRVVRGRWMEDPAIAKLREQSKRETVPAVTVSNVSPQQAVLMELAGLGQKSKLSLARGVAKAAQTVEELDGKAILAMSGDVKNITQTANVLHGWQDQPQPNRMRLEVLLARPESHVDAIEIESEIVTGQWDADTTEAQAPTSGVI